MTATQKEDDTPMKNHQIFARIENAISGFLIGGSIVAWMWFVGDFPDTSYDEITALMLAYGFILGLIFYVITYAITLIETTKLIETIKVKYFKKT
ncbi:MAG: hypothetical protein NLN64_02405 [Candidatus Thalassarchaeaceae archaeon]|nr:hypothetical protein [Candidatus Thalassarchaeaceae archaeon]